MEPGSYHIVPDQSKIGFLVVNLMVLRVSGRFQKFSGNVEVAEPFSASRVRGDVELDSIDTDWKSRDEHLKDQDFFDVGRYPRMIFQSRAISGTPKRFNLQGELELHGVRRSLSLDCRERPDGVIEAFGNLNRSDFGLTAGPTIRDRVDLHLEIALAKSPASNAGLDTSDAGV